MKWDVRGAMKATGKDCWLVVDAADRDSAEQAATAKGILVESVAAVLSPSAATGAAAENTIRVGFISDGAAFRFGIFATLGSLFVGFIAALVYWFLGVLGLLAGHR